MARTGTQIEDTAESLIKRLGPTKNHAEFCG